MTARLADIKLSFHKETHADHSNALAEFTKWNNNGGPHSV